VKKKKKVTVSYVFILYLVQKKILRDIGQPKVVEF
jgi:hypothetical protein